MTGLRVGLHGGVITETASRETEMTKGQQFAKRMRNNLGIGTRTLRAHAA